MSEFKYPHLFDPIRLGGQLFRNRIFAAPTGIRCMRADSIYPEEVFQYYRRKAMGGAAAVATGQYMVDAEKSAGYPEQICLDRPGVDLPLGKLAFAISRYGAVPVLELSHCGMYANRRSASINDGKSYGDAYGPVEMELGDRIIKPMTEEMIEQTIAKFAQAAANGKKWGYGMVMLHAGHGWFFHQFLSPTTNTRKDKWGGPDIENRARITIATCDAIRKAVGPKFPIEIRISGSECFDGGYDIEEGIKFAKLLDGHVDLIHVSAGNHEVRDSFVITHPSMFIGDGPNVRFAAAIKPHVKTAVATIGALGEAEMMEDIIASGKADVVELARSLIADPDLPNKIRMGREKEINVCLRCLNCFANQQSHGVKYCAVNPESGHEHETLWEPRQSGRKKRVLIVGGGIGGMEAAITAAGNGHEVILCEKNDELGGNIRCEKNVPFKHKLDEYLAGQEYKVRKAAIDVRLNTEVTPEYAESLRPDVIIAAMGARPIKPPIPGIDGKKVIGAEYAYIHPETVGDKAVVLGGGLVGLEIALYLAMMGKKITVVEMMDRINDGGNPLHIIGLNIQLRKYGIDLHFKTKAMEINEKGVRCEAEDGDKFFEADNVIYAVGQRPLQEEALALRTCAPEFYMVGDCVVSKNIPAATSVAHDVALNIGRV